MKSKFSKVLLVITLFILTYSCTHEVGVLNPLFSSRLNDTVASIPFDSTSSFGANCDSTKINYKEHIQPIMVKYCVSCHSSSLKLGGYDLSTYVGTLVPAKSGKLLGSVQHSTGYSPMPSASLFISNCEIQLIKRWAEQSYKFDTLGTIVDTSANAITPPANVDSSINTCNPDTVYFASQILPLMLSSCAMSGCHDVISKKDGVIMTDYTNIMKIVKAGNPTSSKLYKSLIDTDPEDRMPMAPIPPFTQSQIDLVYKWIAQGAKNNACVNNSLANCTTSNMSFTRDIQPIFAANCNGCHNATAPSAGINLTTYNGTNAISSRLVGSITHAAGYAPMPTASIKLSTCDINKISAWITQGKLNN
jgi:mono/diheme cytochrome c family protein